MVNEGIAVFLPVVVDFVVALHFHRIDGVAFVPCAHIILHPLLHVPPIHSGFIAAGPSLPVRHAEVEVSASKVSLQVISYFKALASG